MPFSYKQLKSWRGLGKAFNELSWENLIAAAGGGWIGWQIAQALPFLPWWLVYIPPVVGGIALTWPYQGRLVYVLVGLWTRFYFRRLFAPATLEIYSAHYYRTPVAPTQGVISAALVVDPREGTQPSMLPPGLRGSSAAPEDRGAR